MILFELIYIGFCLVLAIINAVIIKEGKPIHHWINGALHVGFWIAGFFVMGWKVIALPFIGRIFFDMLLSMFRGFSPFYVSASPTSEVDRLEKFIFGMNGWLPKLIYLIIAVVINVV